MIFIQIRSLVLGIHHLESHVYYEIFYYAQSNAHHYSNEPSICDAFNNSHVQYISDTLHSITPNLYTIPNIQNMRFFCCSVYIFTWLYIYIYIYNQVNNLFLLQEIICALNVTHLR